jgi:hypothetical protein
MLFLSSGSQELREKNSCIPGFLIEFRLMKIRRSLWLFAFLILVPMAVSCGAPAAEMEAAAPQAEEATQAESGEAPEEPTTDEYEAAAEAQDATEAEGAAAVAATTIPLPSPAATRQLPTPTPIVEARTIEIEWPERIHLGDSDVVRLAIVPSEAGYTLTTEFPDHQTITQDVPVIRPSGYDLFAVARLEGVKFEIAPSGEQAYHLPEDQPVTWHWSLTPRQPGNHRLTISLSIRWVPLDVDQGEAREAVAYSKGLDVHVPSFLGLTRGQAMTTGLFGAMLGSAVSLFGFLRKPRHSRPALEFRKANPQVKIEVSRGISLEISEKQLLQTLFNRYNRLSVLQEFRSGYSGARTFLLLPHRIDGHTDAHTIAKIGYKDIIQQEFANFQTYVKHTLPPITARIQQPPISVRGSDKAGLQYTFIGEPGSLPTSLRQALLDNPDPIYLEKLFETFGANWWSQRSAYTFQMAQEYDRLLPPHYVVEPASGKTDSVLGGQTPWQGSMPLGSLVSLENFSHVEPRSGYISLSGEPQSGQPALRVHWHGEAFSRTVTGKIIAKRATLLDEYTQGFERYGLPDPLKLLPSILMETVAATRSIIHGDLNLENILVGPGDIIWLIDFAETRQGPPLADFAHLETEIISHIIAPEIDDPRVYVNLLDSLYLSIQSDSSKFQPLLNQLHTMANRCLLDPTQGREYTLAQFISCLGVLKYRNLDRHQKQLLFVTAAYLAQSLT